MHATSILLQTLALALTITALPSPPSLQPRQNEVVCQTSGASPYTDDVTGAINQLNGRSGSSCAQSNSKGSDCKTVAKQGTAAIVVCGTNENWLCGVVAGYANSIQNGNGCLSGDDKVGGMYLIGDAKVELVHS